MDARKLLKEWPKEAFASADGIFGSPAWRMSVDYDGAPCLLTKAEEPVADALSLSLNFDGASSVLRIADSPSFPDLHLLWWRRDDLPREVLLALVEKECGTLFQMLEETMKQLVEVKGFADAEAEASVQGVTFTLRRPDGESLGFALGLSAEQRARLGSLDHLDLTHESIRSMTRSGWAQYAQLDLSAADCVRLAAGDCLLLPEGEKAVWLPVLADDEVVRICGAQEGTLSFAELVDEELPSIPPMQEVNIFRGMSLLAKGRVEMLCEQRIVRIEEIVHAS